MDELDLTNDEAMPKWNYTLQPAEKSGVILSPPLRRGRRSA